MTEHWDALLAFLVGGGLMGLLPLWADGRIGAWLGERRLDWRVRRIARRRDLDAAYELIVAEEQASWAAEADSVDPVTEAFNDVLLILGPPPGWSLPDPDVDGFDEGGDR